ncbi:hypothetical protein P4S63_18665 [Pseudoalteromonas sp. B193]
MTHIKKLLLAAACSTALLGSNAVSANTDNQNADLKTVATFDAQHLRATLLLPIGQKVFICAWLFGQKQKIMELLSDGTTKPYPNEEWAYAYNNGKGFTTYLA